MTVSERIFDRLHEIDMSQREFSEKTGIAQSTISEWKSKGTNPTTEKIMPICVTLKVSPEWLLSGAMVKGTRSNALDYFVIDKESDMGQILVEISKMDKSKIDRLAGYIAALGE